MFSRDITRGSCHVLKAIGRKWCGRVGEGRRCTVLRALISGQRGKCKSHDLCSERNQLNRLVVVLLDLLNTRNAKHNSRVRREKRLDFIPTVRWRCLIRTFTVSVTFFSFVNSRRRLSDFFGPEHSGSHQVLVLRERNEQRPWERRYSGRCLVSWLLWWLILRNCGLRDYRDTHLKMVLQLNVHHQRKRNVPLQVL